MSEQPDWKSLVDELATRNQATADMVAEAKGQANGNHNFWEAVYTLVRQRMQMEGNR